jgi:hypothetical protein
MKNTEQLSHWFNRFGEAIPLSEMETGYLYNTVKMIFNNHLMPSNPFGDVIQWSFIQPVHTPDFLTRFYFAGMKELKKRGDNAMARDFIVHAEHFLKKKIEIGLKKYFNVDEIINES